MMESRTGPTAVRLRPNPLRAGLPPRIRAQAQARASGTEPSTGPKAALSTAVRTTRQGASRAMRTVLWSGVSAPFGLLALVAAFAARNDWWDTSMGIVALALVGLMLGTIGAVLGLVRGVALAAGALVSGIQGLLLSATSLITDRVLQMSGVHKQAIPISKLDAVFDNWSTSLQTYLESKGWAARGVGWLVRAMIRRVQMRLKKDLSSRRDPQRDIQVSELEERIRAGLLGTATAQLTTQVGWMRTASSAGIALLFGIVALGGLLLG